MLNFSIKHGSRHVKPSTKTHRAVTQFKNGSTKSHPLSDNSYEEGSSDGLIYTHAPMPGQDFISVKPEGTGNVHYAVFNNLQMSDSIGRLSSMSLDHTSSEEKALRKILGVVRLSEDKPIYLQSKAKTGVIQKSYRHLDKNDSKNLGLSDKKFSEIEAIKEKLNFSSQSEEDSFHQKIKNILNDNLEKDTINKGQYKLDCKNIPKTQYFDNLDGFQMIEHLNFSRLLLNEYTLDDDYIASRIDNSIDFNDATD